MTVVAVEPRRIFAYLIDTAITIILPLSATLLTSAHLEISTIAMCTFSFIFAAAYWSLLVGKLGCTIGTLTTRIRYRTQKDTGTIGIRRGALRFLLLMYPSYIILFLPALLASPNTENNTLLWLMPQVALLVGIGYFYQLGLLAFTYKNNGRGWHDRASGTVILPAGYTHRKLSEPEENSSPPIDRYGGFGSQIRWVLRPPQAWLLGIPVPRESEPKKGNPAKRYGLNARLRRRFYGTSWLPAEAEKGTLPAGWYPESSDGVYERYWDGYAPTNRRRLSIGHENE